MGAEYDMSQKKAIYKWRDCNKDKYNAYMKMYNKLYRYCKTPELIENYEKAKADNFEDWMIHHRLEEFYSRKELIDMGRYNNVPAEELIFVKGQKEHFAQKHKTMPKIPYIKKGYNPWNKGKLSEEIKKRMAEAHKGQSAWNKGKKGKKYKHSEKFLQKQREKCL